MGLSLAGSARCAPEREPRLDLLELTRRDLHRAVLRCLAAADAQQTVLPPFQRLARARVNTPCDQEIEPELHADVPRLGVVAAHAHASEKADQLLFVDDLAEPRCKEGEHQTRDREPPPRPATGRVVAKRGGARVERSDRPMRGLDVLDRGIILSFHCI